MTTPRKPPKQAKPTPPPGRVLGEGTASVSGLFWCSRCNKDKPIDTAKVIPVGEHHKVVVCADCAKKLPPAPLHEAKPMINMERLIVWTCVIGTAFSLGVPVGYQLGEKAGIVKGEARANGVCKIICEEQQRERIGSKALDMIEQALDKVKK